MCQEFCPQGGCLPHCMLGYPHPWDQRQTPHPDPRSRLPSPQSRPPPGTDPQAQCMLGDTGNNGRYASHWNAYLSLESISVLSFFFFYKKVKETIGRSKRGRQGRAPPRGPNFFIFMQFQGKKLKNNSTFGSWRTPLGKILDPPLETLFSVTLTLFLVLQSKVFC